MPDTELEISTRTKLALIAQRARKEPQCQFTSLAHLLDERFLAACYHWLGGAVPPRTRKGGDFQVCVVIGREELKPLPAKGETVLVPSFDKLPIGLDEKGVLSA